MAETRIYCYCLLLSVLLVPLSAKIKSGEEYRLPSTSIPDHYQLNIFVEEPNFHGQTVISFNSTEDSNYLYLHAAPKTLLITKVILNFVKSCTANITNEETEIVTIDCSQPIKKGSHHLVIDYIGRYPSEQYVGLYKTYYGSNNHWYASTQFEPTYARRVFPCFDEPGFKATFDITITSPEGYTVLANTPMANQTYLPTGFVVTQFQTTPRMPTYTVAFVVSQLEKGTKHALSKLQKFNFEVYARPGMEEFAKTAVTYGPSLLKKLGEFTDINYESLGNPQIDQVAVIDFEFGAMENWGLVIYREAYILDEGEKTSALQKQRIITTVAHELAHQWFGNLVTLDWWSNAWLNEGFATYCQYFIPASIKEIDMQIEEQFVVDVIQAGLDLDASPSTSPLSSENVQTEDQDLAKFDSVTYKKGASILKMIENILGKKQFEAAIQDYISNNKYKNVDPLLLLNAFEEYFNGNITELMYNWIYKPGYPILNVELSEDSKYVLVNQEPFSYFASNGSSNDTEENKWFVPISYARSDELNFTDDIKEWVLPNKTLQIPLKNADWIVLNSNRKNFYRVNYSPELWSRIIKQIKSKDIRERIPPNNRAAFIDDIFASARTGRVEYDLVLDLLDYLRHETSYQPWSAALKGFNHLLERFGNDDKFSQLLNEVILDLLNSAFPDVSDDNSNHIDIIKNALIMQWKCKTGYKTCLSDAVRDFEEYKVKNYIENFNRRETVLCYGFQNSKNVTADYHYLLNAYDKTGSVIEKAALLSAIGCSSDPDIFRLFYKELLSKNSIIKRHDAADAYRAVLSSKIGVTATLTFLNSTFDFEYLLWIYDGVIDLSSLMTDVGNKITTKEEQTLFKNIIHQNRDYPSMDAVAPQALRLVELNLEWADKYNEQVKEAVKKYNTTSAASSKDFLPLTLFLFFIILNYFK